MDYDKKITTRYGCKPLDFKSCRISKTKLIPMPFG